MGFSYKPLFKLLVDRNMKKTDLLTEVGLSSATLAKLSKGGPLAGESIEKLCIYFRCQPGELVEYVLPDILPLSKTKNTGTEKITKRRKEIKTPNAAPHPVQIKSSTENVSHNENKPGTNKKPRH